MKLLSTLGLLLILLVAACSLIIGDLALPEAPDMAQPDMAQPDMAQPDLAQPDLPMDGGEEDGFPVDAFMIY